MRCVCLCVLKAVYFVVIYNLMLYGCVCLYVHDCVCAICLNVLVWSVCGVLCVDGCVVLLLCLCVFV